MTVSMVFSKSGNTILSSDGDGGETVVNDETSKELSFPNDGREKSVWELSQAILFGKLEIFTSILLSA